MQHQQNSFDRLPLEGQDEHRHQFPHTGYWLGSFLEHPDIQHQQQQSDFLPYPSDVGLGMAQHPQVPVPHPTAPIQLQPCTDIVVTAVAFSLPLKAAQVEGRVAARAVVMLPFDIPFNDFWDRVCARMGLNPHEAKLGYKFHNHRVRDDPIPIVKDSDLRVAISTAQGMVWRARSKEIYVIIHNLEPSIETPAALRVKGKKRKGTCAGVPTKKSRTSSRSPLNARNIQRTINATEYPTIPAADPCFPIYPTIGDALQQLHSDMPDLDMPLYELGLQQYGVFSIDEAEGLDATFLQHEVGMSVEAIGPFGDHIRQLLSRARAKEPQPAGQLVVKD